LDKLAARVAALGEAENRYRHGSPDDRATWRLRLSALRRAATVDSALVASRLAEFERALVRAEHGARTADRRTDAISADRGLLQAWKAKAPDGELVEHVGLAAAYRKAHELLNAEPVDQAAAHAAVRAYQDAVRQTLAKGKRR
jgi:hypothetical protein